MFKKKIIANILTLLWFGFLVFLPIFSSTTYAQSTGNAWRYDDILQEVIAPIQGNLDQDFILGTDSAESTKDFIMQKVMDVAVPIFIGLWIMMAMFGMYSVMFSWWEWDFQKWIRYIIFWVAGILIILSAEYITNIMAVEIMGNWQVSSFVWVEVAQTLYEKIAYPFLKMAIYIVLWLLFVMLLINVIKYITSSEDEIHKQSVTMIIWSFISMFIIIWSKQLVEAVYWKEQDIINSNAQTLWDIWDGILASKEIPIIYTIINWVLWIAGFIILIIILFQTFKFLTNPSDEEQLSSIKKSLLYIFLWIVVIWAGYLIVNFLIIN